MTLPLTNTILPINQIVCMDCLDFMKTLSDKSIDLVLTDPPYGITWSATTLFGKETPQTKALKDLQQWDKRPDKCYFDEIKRVSFEQVIWGGNYFADYLGVFKSPLVWDKMTGDNNYADGELAWTSLGGTLRIFRHQWCGAFKDSERQQQNLHPTQKPVALGLWILENYSKPDDLILDCYCGSGSFCVAAKMLGRRFIGIDISPEYCKIARERLEAIDTGVPVKEARKGQKSLFAPEQDNFGLIE